MDKSFQLAAAELARREMEALRVFRPQKHQVRVFTSPASELLIQGGSRAGKSICMAAEVASAATGQPVIGLDGNPLPYKYPRNRPLTIWLVGKGEDHCATWHRLLLEPQPELKMLRDERTGAWRPHDPVGDRDREDLHIMGPMIPHRLILNGYRKGISWVRYRERLFSCIRLAPRPEFGSGSPGTVIWYWSSGGEVKKGDPVDLIAIDEHIEIPEHYNEWQARLSDRKGRIIWAICPDTKRNTALNDLIDRCKREEGMSDLPMFERVILKFTDNAYIDDTEKAKRKASMDSRHWANRDRGELLEGDAQVYPEFSELRHGSPAITPKLDDAVDAALRNNGGAIPHNWTRELILDPGSAHPGVLMCAIPPPDLGEAGVVYDELYLPNSDPMTLAEALRDKLSGQRFHRFIIDYRAGIQRTIGTSLGKTTYLLYADAFQKFGLVCELTGSNFQLSSDNWSAGCAAVRLRLANLPHGRPWLRFMRGGCYNFVRMMESYERAVDKRGFVEDKPATKQIDCLCDCVRYWVASEPSYSEPPKNDFLGGPAYQLYKQIEEEKSRRASATGVFLGAGSI